MFLASVSYRSDFAVRAELRRTSWWWEQWCGCPRITHGLVFSVGIWLKKACFVAYFPLSSSFCPSLSPPSLHTFHTMTFPPHPLGLIQRGFCGLDVDKHQENIHWTWGTVCFWFVTGPGKPVLSYSTTLYCKYTQSDSCVYSMCSSCCSHWAQTGKIKHCCTLWVWTEAAIANSEAPVQDW